MFRSAPKPNSEAADLAREKRALEEKPKAELRELTQIYVERGLAPELAREVAQQLMARDALGAHKRDELGFAEGGEPNPVLAAGASAAAFALGAALPAIAAFLAPREAVVAAVSIAALVFLAALGALGAWLGGAPVVKPTVRVAFWGAFAMAVTAGIGALVGKAV